jgi:hypothetical protein
MCFWADGDDGQSGGVESIVRKFSWHLLVGHFRTVGPFTRKKEARTVTSGEGLQTPSPGEGMGTGLLAGEASRRGGPIPFEIRAL